MQADQNSFCVDVVLDSVNMVFRDEDSILDQMYRKNMFVFFMMIFKIIIHENVCVFYEFLVVLLIL